MEIAGPGGKNFPAHAITNMATVLFHGKYIPTETEINRYLTRSDKEDVRYVLEKAKRLRQRNGTGRNVRGGAGEKIQGCLIPRVLVEKFPHIFKTHSGIDNERHEAFLRAHPNFRITE